MLPVSKRSLWSQYLTLPLPPPLVVAFEAKWGVNKSNMRCIVWHPKGPNEVTLEVQITSGHGLLAFSCSISLRLSVPHTENATQPPTAAIKWFIYIWVFQIDWMGPFWWCASTGLLSVQNRDHRVVKERSTYSVSQITQPSDSDCHTEWRRCSLGFVECHQETFWWWSCVQYHVSSVLSGCF